MKKTVTKKEKMQEDCGGLKPIPLMKPPKKTTKKTTKKSK